MTRAAARRHQAWASAVAHLERVRDPRAVDLRWLWAEHLAATGDPAGAVDVAWPLADRRAALQPWIERGLTVDDPAAARAMGARAREVALAGIHAASPFDIPVSPVIAQQAPIRRLLNALPHPMLVR